MQPGFTNRRGFLAGCGAAAAACFAPRGDLFAQDPPAAAPRVEPEDAATAGKALVTITLDLEMSRNFPQWDDTHWDYEKGNLNEPTKSYAMAAARRMVLTMA